MAENTEKKIRKFFQVGTMECVILCIVLAVVLWILFITVGFWKTLLFAALIAIAVFIGGTTNKKELIQGGVSKVAAKRDNYAGMKREELEQKVRETVKRTDEEVAEAAEDAEEAVEQAQDEAEAVVEEAQEAVEAAYRDRERWAAMAIRNVACSGKFSSDRTIEEYVRDIWHLEKMV